MADKELVSAEQYGKAVFEEGGSLVVDLTDIEEAKFELVPRGMYPAEIDDLVFGRSENSGQPMWTITVRLTHPDYERVKRRVYWSFSQKALPYTKANIKRVWPELLQGAFKPEEIANSGKLMGKPVRVRVSHEKDEQSGEQRDRVQNILPPENAQTNGAGNATGGKFF